MSDTILRQEAQKHGFPYEKKGRVLVWHDEFDAEAINFDNWSFERSMTGADRTYDNSEACCRIEDCKLRMTAYYEEGNPEKPYRLCEGFTTKGRMLFKYGYLEMRARPPFRYGTWPSFWMKSHTPYAKADWFSEIDIYEIFSNPTSVICNLHKWGKREDGSWAHCSYDGSEANMDRAYTFPNPEHLNEEYHVYGFEWDEKRITFYVDDVPYKSFAISGEEGNIHPEVVNGVQGFHDFHFVLMNNEFFSPKGDWPAAGWFIRPCDFPIDYHIDWIRLYQKPEKEEIRRTAEIAAQAEAVKNTDATNKWLLS